MTQFTESDRAEIRAAIKRHRITQQQIADSVQSGRSTVSLWLSGDVSSPALDKAIPAYVNGVLRGAELAANRAAA